MSTLVGKIGRHLYSFVEYCKLNRFAFDSKGVQKLIPERFAHGIRRENAPGDFIGVWGLFVGSLHTDPKPQGNFRTKYELCLR